MDRKSDKTLARALASLQAGRLENAERDLKAALRKDPRHVGVLNLLGVLHTRQGRLLDAETCINRAIAAGSVSDATFYNHGVVLKALGRPREAIDQFTRALSINPTVADSWNSRGTAFNDLRRHAEALADFDRAIALNPRAAEAHSNKGNALTALRRFDDAGACFAAALALDPGLAEAWAGRGTLLFELNDYDAADDALRQALALKPALAVAWLARGNLLTARNRPNDAMECFARAQALAPEAPDAHFAEACCRLKFGDAEGWKKYEWRWARARPTPSEHPFDRPLWLGDTSIVDKRVLLHAEQGLGDTIQFCRFVGAIADRGARVTLEVQPELTALLASLAGPEHVIASGEPRPPHDLHCPLGSLALALRIGAGDLRPAPYLSVSQSRIDAWERRLEGIARPRIGLAWAGNPAFRGDHNRSIGLARLLPLVHTLDARFVSLQKNASETDRRLLQESKILSQEDSLSDFVDTGALMNCLDLIIASDTSIVHLAGALGRPVWILLHYDADWRWLADRADSPWYPTARLFRQAAPGDWSSVVTQAIADWRRG